MAMQCFSGVRFARSSTSLGAAWRTLGCRMNWRRREFFCGAFVAGWSAATTSACAQQADTSSSDYSETVALVLFTPGGEQELGLRLARMPGRHTSTIWAEFDGDRGSLSLDDRAVLAADARATEANRESACVFARRLQALLAPCAERSMVRNDAAG